MIIKSINLLLLFIRYNILLIIVNIVGQEELNAVVAISEKYVSRRERIRQCETPLIPNGFIRIRGRLARIRCKKTYQLIGTRYAQCTTGKWDAPIPVCAKDGCEHPELPENGYFTNENRGATLMLYCKDGYKVAGQRFAYCNGTNWDRTLGQCRASQEHSALHCDFETDDICGWTHDDSPEFEWKRKSGSSNLRKLHTGPIYDHTTKMSDNGHFMLLEPQDQKIGDQARLLSPVYFVNSSTTMCFRIWYYMLGLGVGTLRIYVKPMSIDLDTMMDDKKYLYFEMTGNQRNFWHEAFFNIEKLYEEFQIVIEGTVGSLHLSDIAIDDAALLTGTDCPDADYQLTSPSIEKEDDNVITDIQTCENRCNETESKMKPDEINILIKNDRFIKICDCHMDCDISQTCCPDYRSICGFVTTETQMTDDESSVVDYAQSLPTAETTIVNAAPPFPNTKTTIVGYSNSVNTAVTNNIDYENRILTTNTPVVDNAKPFHNIVTPVIDYVRPFTTAKAPVFEHTKYFSTTRIPLVKYTNRLPPFRPYFIDYSSSTSSTIRLTSTTSLPPTSIKTTLSTFKIFNTKGAKTESWMKDSMSTQSTFRHLPINQFNDTTVNNDQHFQDKHYLKRIDSVHSLFTLLLIVILISIIVLSIIAVIYRYYKKKFLPENYKSNSNGDQSCIRNANNDFSEIRYLTSDDNLDFTLQTASNNTQQYPLQQKQTINEETIVLSSSSLPCQSKFECKSKRNKTTSNILDSKKIKKLSSDKTKNSKQNSAEVKLLDDFNETEDSCLLDDYDIYNVCQ